MHDIMTHYITNLDIFYKATVVILAASVICQDDPRTQNILVLSQELYHP